MMSSYVRVLGERRAGRLERAEPPSVAMTPPGASLVFGWWIDQSAGARIAPDWPSIATARADQQSSGPSIELGKTPIVLARETTHPAATSRRAARARDAVRQEPEMPQTPAGPLCTRRTSRDADDIVSAAVLERFDKG